MVLSVTLVAVVAFGVPLGVAARRLYANEATLRLERAAASSAILVPRSFQQSGDPVELPRSAEGIGLSLYGPNGRRVTGFGPSHADPVVEAAIRGAANTGTSGRELVAAIPLTSNERVYGVLRAAMRQDRVTDRIWRTWAAMAGTAVAALLLAALVAWWQTRRLVRPVRELASAADRLGAGDFSVRPAPTGIEELDVVASTLGRTSERLGRMIGRERTFSEDASHQLRNPLTGLRLRLETARTTPSMTRDELIDGSLADLERLDNTVEALLALAREEHPERSELDVAALLRAIEETWHGRLAALGRRLHLRGSHVRTHVHVSTPALHQVLDVLVSNAMQHGAGTVTVDAHDVAGGLAIDVIDEGRGIRAPAEAVFSRRSRSGASHGIGLALARSLIEAEGGRLLVRHSGPRPVFRVLFVGEPPSADPASARPPARHHVAV